MLKTREEFERLAAQNAQRDTDYANRVFDVLEGKTPRSTLEGLPEMETIAVTSGLHWSRYLVAVVIGLVCLHFIKE